jgi:parvulin-like peptidyl-prolyl isomerase
MKLRSHGRTSQLTTLFAILVLLWGCASAPKKDDTLAFVDGDPVTRRDLEYSLEIAHRREDLSTARELNINQYVEKLIDDRLIVHEARRMGIDEYPEVEEKVRDYVLRESVVRLYSEEVLEKVFVTDEEINDYYKTNYERFTLDIIEAGTEEDAGAILVKLKNGESFQELSRTYPASVPKKGGNGYVFTPKSMTPAIQEALTGLNAGEYSDVARANEKYYIIRVISREEAPVEELDSIRGSIEGTLKKEKIKKRSDEYLAQLHSEASITIDKELLSSIRFDKGIEEREQWVKDSRPLVKVNGEVLSAGQFAAMLPLSDKTAKEKTLNRWLDRKLVDQEALSRHYDEKSDLKDKLDIYKNQLIKNMFSINVIASKINISDEELQEYYVSHKDAYIKPVRYRIQQISLDELEDANEVLKSLNEGANFSWIAEKRSTDSYAAMGGVIGWESKETLSQPVQEIIDNLEPGDISPVLNVNGHYRIIRLMEKTGKEVEEFDRVIKIVYRAAHKEKFQEKYTEYVNKLRREARIEINDEVVRSYEKIFNN